jgi:anti-anti-sigma factor
VLDPSTVQHDREANEIGIHAGVKGRSSGCRPPGRSTTIDPTLTIYEEREQDVTSNLDQLRITLERAGGQEIVHLDGDLDPHTAPLLQKEVDRLVEGGHLDIVLDMSRLVFIDSCGLRVVISAHRATAERGGQLTLRSPSETAQRLLEITGLVDHITIAAG